MKTRRNLMVAGLTMFGLVSIAPFAAGNQRTEDPLGIAVSPHMLVLDHEQAGAVKVHTAIPLCLVNPLTLKLNGVPAIGAYADSLGQLVAVFDEGDIKSIVSPPFAELTLTGEYVTGGPFAGTDLVTVRRVSRKQP